MAQAARSSHGLLSFLDDGGGTHPLQNTVAAATLLIGVVAFITGIFDSLYVFSSWAGLIGLLTGAWGQMISETTGERFLLIIGLGGSAVGLYLGMSHGGLVPGMFG
jgi:hypothetical protein